MPDKKSKLSPEHVKLQAILENAVDAIITIDEHGIIESVNPATKSLFDYTADELLGKNVAMLMPSPYQESHDEYLKNYIDSGVPKIIGIGREVVGKRKDGSMFPIHLAVSEVCFDGRRMFTGIVRDISDLKEAERKLENLNEKLEERVRLRSQELFEAQEELVAKEKLAALGQISGGIAHEIRNPLHAVRTSAYYLLNAESASEAKKKEHLARIDRQVVLIDNVIKALTDVANLPEPELTTVPAAAILTQVVDEVVMPEGIRVQLQISEEDAQVLVDQNQIPIVFRNLLRNARDAMPKGGTLTIAVHREGDKVAISVSDTGVGIAEADLKQILKPLYSTKQRGMGLGLAICKAIVEKNGGRLLIDSELGSGSKFTVELDANAN